MKKSLQWIFLAVVAVIVVGLVVLEVATSVTEGQRAKAVASVEKPEAVRFHEQLAAEAAAMPKTSSDDVPDENDPSVPLSPHEIIARWARLFERVRELMDPEGRWVEFWAVPNAKDKGEMTQEERVLKQEWEAEREDVAREIHAMTKIGGPVIALDLSREGFPAFRQHLEDLRACVSVLTWGMHEGGTPDTAEGIMSAIELADMLAEEPHLDSQVCRREIYGTIYFTLAALLANRRFPPELGAELLARLAKADARQALARGLAAKRFTQVEYRKEWRERSLAASLERDGLLNGGRNWLWMTPLCAPWSNTDESSLLEYLQRLQGLADKPYHAIKPELDAIDAEVSALSIMKDTTLRMIPRIRTAFAEQAEIETLVDLMQLGLLLEAYHAEHGVYPDSLEAIAPGLGGELPVDPFSGEGYHYRLEEKFFLLYSVGPDGADNGGTPREREWEGPQGGPGDITCPPWGIEMVEVESETTIAHP